MVRTFISSAWIFCLPALLTLLAVAGYPLARTFYFSLTDAKLSTLDTPGWIGLENYRYLLMDGRWWHSVLNSVVFATVSVSLEAIAGLGIALILNARFAGRGLLRASVLIPWAIPAVVSAKMWAWMLNDLFGIVNELLLGLGLIHVRIAWLASDRLALATLVAVDAWKSTPFMALLILAGLQGIPRSVEEAATLDGAPPLLRFFKITLPLVRPALLVAVIFRSLDALRVFDLPFVLTSNSRETAVMTVYARQQLVDFQDIGYGSAASVLIFLVIAVIAVAYVLANRKSLGVEEA